MARLFLKSDDSKWQKEIRARYRKLSSELNSSVATIASQADSIVDDVVRQGLDRPENPGRRSTSLTQAIRASIAPQKAKAAGFTHAVRVTDYATLDALAPHWHVIEVGGLESGHFQKVRGISLISFGARVGGRVVPPYFRPHPDEVGVHTDAIGVRTGLDGIQRPIDPHNYLSRLSAFVTVRFEEELSRRFKESFS